MKSTITKPDPTPENNVSTRAEAALSDLAAAVAELRTNLSTVTARANELIDRRTALYNAPLSAADIRQFVGELIDHRAAHYKQALQDFKLASKLSYPARNTIAINGNTQPLNLEDASRALGIPVDVPNRKDGLDGDGWKLPLFLSYGEFEGWAYFYFGDVMKEKLCAALSEMQPGPTGGRSDVDVPLMNDRRQEIVAISAELLELEFESMRLRSEISRLSNPIVAHALGLRDKASESV